MANILVLTSFYLQKDNVLSNNVTKIVDVLRKNNMVVCISEELISKENYFDENLKVVTTKTSFLTRKILLTKKKKYIWLNRFKSAFLWWAYPNIDIAQTRRKKKVAEEEFENTEFDIVISFYRQYSNIQAMMDVKRKHPKVKMVAVFLDLLEAYIPFGFDSNNYLALCEKIEKKLLNSCECCFFPANYETKALEKFGGECKNRIRIFDYPLYHYRERKSVIQQGKIKLLYAGTVDSYYRNPLKLLNVLNELGNVCEKFELYFYVAGDCVEQIIDFSKRSNFTIHVNGLIDHVQLMKKMEEADILVNINNYMQKAVPSKIFEMASFGKPMIDYSFTEDDFTNHYFERYPIAYIVKDWEKSIEQRKMLATFISSAREKVVSKEELDMIFQKNTAEYFVELLRPILNVKGLNDE